MKIKTKKKTALILGVTGQDGILLSKILIKKKYDVHGLSRSKYKFDIIKKKYLKYIKHYKCDICETKKIIKLIHTIKPDEIYNFAGVTDLKTSEKDKNYTLKVNYNCIKIILDQIYSKNNKVKFFQSLSSEMFKKNIQLPKNIIDEKSRLKVNNFYSLSKIKLFKYIKNLRSKKKVPIFCGFLFNHDSFFRDKRFISKKISNHLKKNILKRPMKIQNLYFRKDISHAENIVEGIYKLMQSKMPLDVVIGSGQFISIKQIITLFLKKLRINAKWKKSGKKIYLKNVVNSNILFYSSNKIELNTVLVANPLKLQKISSWKPDPNIKKIINDLVL